MSGFVFPGSRRLVGLSSPEKEILSAIGEDAPLTVSEIRRVVKDKKESLTRRLQVLRQRGLVVVKGKEKRPSGEVCRWARTPRGTEKLREKRAQAAKGSERELLDGMD